MSQVAIMEVSAHLIGSLFVLICFHLLTLPTNKGGV